MSKPSERKSKSHSNGEIFTAFVTDSQDSLEQPKGEFKDLFKRLAGKGNERGTRKTLSGSESPRSSSPVRKFSKKTE